MTEKIFNEPRMRAMMEREGIELVVLSSFANSAYVSGFLNNGGHLSYRPFVVFYFLDEARKPAFIVPAVDLHLAMHFTWIEDVRAYAMAEFFTDLDVHFYDDFLSAARDVLAERNVTNLVVGTEGDNLPKAIRGGLDELLSGNEVVDVSSKMDLVRMVKTPGEVSHLRRAADITIKAHESFRAAIKPGNTDRDLFTAANVRMFEEGADGIEFINVGTGPVSYAAHCPFPIGHVLEEGDFVKVDMGRASPGVRGRLRPFLFHRPGHQPAEDHLAVPERSPGRARAMAAPGGDRRRDIRTGLPRDQPASRQLPARVHRPRHRARRP